MSEQYIQLRQVSKVFSTEPLSGIKNLDLSLSKGQLVAILGESGSGKSTLLKLIYGLLSPDTGEVYFDGQRILGPEEKLIPGNDRMKIIAQDFNLNTYAKVYENISAMLSNADLEGKKQRTERIMQLLRIDHLAARRAADLSGGEQQRVAIARALVAEPEVLLLDEPFSQVDVMMRRQLRADLKYLVKELGLTLVLVSHDPLDGLSLADQLVVIRNGELIQKGDPKTLIEQPSNAYVASLLGSANILHPAAAETLLNVKLQDKQRLVIYPHELKIAKKGIPAVVAQVQYRIELDELEVLMGEQKMYLQVPSGQYAVGDRISLELTAYRVVQA